MFSHVTDAFIEEVIKEVRKSFISGNDLLKTSSFLQKEDRFFSWDANYIEGSQFIAGRGPRKPNEMTTFLKDTVFHPLFPVRQIVALGGCLGDDPSVAGVDFCDYLVRGVETFEGYKVTITRISGECTLSPDGKNVYPDPVVQSQLTVTDPHTSESRELRVTLFGLKDNDSFHLAGSANEAQKKALSELIQRSFAEPMFVHCKSGYGRTGHFIAMAEVVKNYENIFFSKHATVVAKNILKMVKRIRKNRPYLLLVPEQLDNAIRNAKVLYQYSLNHQCTQESKRNSALNTARMIARLTHLAAEQRATEEQEEKKSIPLSSNQPNSNIYRTENSGNTTLFDPVNSLQKPPEIPTPTPQFSTPTPWTG